MLDFEMKNKKKYDLCLTLKHSRKLGVLYYRIMSVYLVIEQTVN